VNLLTDAHAAAATLHEAAQLTREDPNRSGSVLTFGAAGQLVMTGDMHGHLRNFEKLQRFCDLARSPGRSVILHELIHCEPDPVSGLDLSIDLLLRAAAWKCEYPDNVYFLQSNHELSQWRAHEITKGGRSVLADFARGVAHRFGRDAERVLEAVEDYTAALPLAARTARGLLLTHSLPDAGALPHFDYGVLERAPTAEDCEPGGAAYELVWGRFQTPEEIDEIAARLGVSAFVVGHTPQESGCAVIGRMIILASDHAHGVFLPIDLSQTPDIAQLARAVRKFVSVE
jgi:hypothetical protein